MGVFSQIAKGARARKRGVECSTLDGVTFTCDLGLLDAAEEAAAMSAATKRAKDGGSAGDEKDLNFQFAYACEVVARAALDPDSPESAPTRFFDGGVEQVRTYLDRDRILLLSETQRNFQESASPRRRTLSLDEYVANVMRLAEEEEGSDSPFWTWPRSTQESFLRSLARQHVASAMRSLPTSSDDEPSASIA
jgi:hypothetical protein